MKRKSFYTVVRKGGFAGVEEQEGYELELNGNVFNAYRDRTNSKVYIVDPENGAAVMSCICLDWYGSEQEVLEATGAEFAESEEFKKWQKIRERESYRVASQLFETCKAAGELWEKHRRLVVKEGDLYDEGL